MTAVEIVAAALSLAFAAAVAFSWRGTFRAFRAELAKVLHRPIVYVAFAAASAAVVAALGLKRLSAEVIKLQGGGTVHIHGFVVFSSCIYWGILSGGLFLLIYAATLMSEEAELGTHKVVFSKPLRRYQVVLAKGLMLFGLSALMVGWVALASYLVTKTTYGFDFEPDAWTMSSWYRPEVLAQRAREAVPQLVLPLFASLVTAFLLSTVLLRSGVAVGVALGIFLLLQGLSGSRPVGTYVANTYFSFAIDSLDQYTKSYSTAGSPLGEPGPPPAPPGEAPYWNTNVIKRGVAVSLAYAVLGLALAAGLTTARNILAWLAAGTAGVGFLLLGLGGGARTAHAGEMRFFTTQSAVPFGHVEDIHASDLDADGLEDFLVYHSVDREGPAPRRHLSIFYQRKDARGPADRVPGVPDQTLEVPPEACALVLEDLDPRPGREIGFIVPSGLVALVRGPEGRAYDPKPVRLFEESGGLYDLPGKGQLPGWGLVADIDKDGRQDIVYPKKGAVSFWLQRPVLAEGGAAPGYVRAGEVPTQYKQTFGARVETMLLGRFLSFYGQLSRPALADVNGDGHQDLVAFADRGLNVHFQRPAETPPFRATPDRRFSLERIVRADSSTDDDAFNYVNLNLDDVDRDGRADLTVYETTGQIGVFESMETRVYFFRGRADDWGKPDGRGGRAPDQRLSLAGVSISPVLIDIDGDGDSDLILSSLRTDLFQTATQALFQSVDVTYFVFRYQKNDNPDASGFSESPDYKRDFTIDLKRVEGRGTIPYAHFWGDYDGDGIQDMLSLEDEDTIAIYPGRVKEGVFGGKRLAFEEGGGERHVIRVETSNWVKIQDFNRDGRGDMLFIYPPRSGEKTRSTFSVVMSR